MERQIDLEQVVRAALRAQREKSALKTTEAMKSRGKAPSEGGGSLDLGSIVRQAVKNSGKKVKRQDRKDEHGEPRQYVRSNTVSNIAKVAGARVDMTTHSNPSKAQVKRAAGQKMLPSNRVFANGCGPGSSRSVMLDAIKAISAEETGCIVPKRDIADKPMKSTTTTDSGWLIGGRDSIA